RFDIEIQGCPTLRTRQGGRRGHLTREEVPPFRVLPIDAESGAALIAPVGGVGDEIDLRRVGVAVNETYISRPGRKVNVRRVKVVQLFFKRRSLIGYE